MPFVKVGSHVAKSRIGDYSIAVGIQGFACVSKVIGGSRILLRLGCLA